jgi:hypothetical protein
MAGLRWTKSSPEVGVGAADRRYFVQRVVEKSHAINWCLSSDVVVKKRGWHLAMHFLN